MGTDDFSDSERDALRELAEKRADVLATVEDRKHRQWLGELLKRWAMWIAAVVAGLGLSWDALSKIVKALADSGK